MSSCGIADIPNWNGGEDGLLAFGDSAVCVNPTSEELASIAISSVRNGAFPDGLGYSLRSAVTLDGRLDG